MLPKLNPIAKTRLDLSRCVKRLNNLLSTYNINQLTEEEVVEAAELLFKINEAIDVTQAKYRNNK